MRGAAIGTQEEFSLGDSEYISKIVKYSGNILDCIEFYDQDDTLKAHWGSPCTGLLAELTPRVLLYFEGQSLAYTDNGHEIALCQVAFHFLYSD